MKNCNKHPSPKDIRLLHSDVQWLYENMPIKYSLRYGKLTKLLLMISISIFDSILSLLTKSTMATRGRTIIASMESCLSWYFVSPQKNAKLLLFCELLKALRHGNKQFSNFQFFFVNYRMLFSNHNNSQKICSKKRLTLR